LPRSFTACCTAFTLALALPASALAESGAATGGTAAPQAQNEQQAQGGDMAVDAPRSALVGDRVQVRGTARRARRRVVRIESRAAGGPWITVVRVRADRKGAFAAVWRPRRAGAYELRARASAASSSGAAGGTAVPVEVDAGGSGSASSLTVYEPSIATWYGPGFFGKQTACGVELTETTVGVAHRELPCGTQVRIVYQGRSIVVPVIDRGPFANNADWDLTQAAAQQLGMTGTSRIGAVPLAPDR
jgi:rare lipoprotein A (peptidoglycan hydrolase)